MSDEQDSVDFRQAGITVGNPTWCLAAIELAFRRGVAGKAWEIARTPTPRLAATPRQFHCRSVHEPDDHALVYVPMYDMLTCDCEAGAWARPCCHAGAVLLLLAGYAPEYGSRYE